MTDHTHPHSPEAERCLLSAYMREPTLLRSISVGADDFHDDRHIRLAKLLRKMLDAGERIDNITVPEKIARLGAVPFGGVAYALEINDHIPGVGAAESYAQIVREHAERRRLMEAGSRAIERASRAVEPSQDVARDLVAEARSAARGGGGEWVTFSDAVDDAGQAMTEREGTGMAGLSTGFPSLDEMTGGLEKGSLYVIAARPKMGKTGLAWQICENVARKYRRTVAVYSMEMGAAELAERTIVGLSKANHMNVRKGSMTSDEWERVLATQDEIRGLPIRLFDRPGVSLSKIESSAYALAARGPLSLIMIDYLQLMDHGAGSAQNLVQAIGRTTSGLKNLARELEVPVVLLSQLSRGLVSRADKRPMPSDLRDSGSIEQDLDALIVLYRDCIYVPEADPEEVEVILRLHRRMPAPETVRMRWVAARFHERAGLDPWGDS